MLSPTEVDALLVDPRLTGNDAAAVGAIKNLSRDETYRVRRVDVATVRDDIRLSQTVSRADYFSDDWFSPDWQEGFEEARARGRAFAADGTGLGGAGGGGARLLAPPDVSTLKVDPHGSAAFVAVLGGLMMQRPKAAAEMVSMASAGKGNSGGGGGALWKVTTPLWSQEFGPITEAQGAAVSTTGQTWARVVECGVDSLCRERFAKQAYDGTIAHFSGRFGVVKHYIMLLTGKQSKVTLFRRATGTRTKDGWVYEPEGTAEGLASTASQILSQALGQKRLAFAVTGGTAMVPPSVKGPSTQGPMPRGIERFSYFTIVSVDAKAKTITMWSPDGRDFVPSGGASMANGYAMTNGRWTMPLREFALVFGGMVVEDQNNATLPGQGRGR
jgi:hypothetical protein